MDKNSFVASIAGTMTLEQILAWDGGGHVGKLELVNGVVRAMAPASATYAIIQGSIVAAINNLLRARNSPCRAGTEAPVIPPLMGRINARAPDVAVTCEQPSDSGVSDNPILIVEDLSPSNERETWESIGSLAALTSLKEILVAQSIKVEAQVIRRDDAGAGIHEPEIVVEAGSVRLRTIGLDLPMSEVYR